MIIRTDAPQYTAEWFQARAGIPTASEFGDFMTSDFELRKGEMLKSFLAKKVAEAWNNGPLPGATTLDMEFGRILEERAVPWYALEYDVSVRQGLYITTDDGRAGCSPDGFVTGQYGLEIKCCRADTHVKYLLGGKVPTDHICQVQGSLFVTGLPEWRFVAYHPKFPKLVLSVHRDEEIMRKIETCLAAFGILFDTAMECLRRSAAQPQAA